MKKRHLHRALPAVLIVVVILLPLSQVGASGNQPQNDAVQYELMRAFEGWSVTVDASRHLSYTITGRSIAFDGVIDITNNSLEAAAPRLQSHLSHVIDFVRYGLLLDRADPVGSMGLVTFRQFRDGRAVESEGIRGIFDHHGRLVYVKVDLLEIAAVSTAMQVSGEQAETAVRAAYANSKIEQLTVEDVVFTEADDGDVHLAHRCYLMVQNPTEVYNVYVDVQSGEVVRQVDLSHEFKFDVTGYVEGAWTNGPTIPYTYDGYPWASEQLYYLVGDWETGYIWRNSPEFFADDSGMIDYQHSVYKAPVEYFMRHWMGNEICYPQSNLGSGYSRRYITTDHVTISGSRQMIKETIALDWTETQLFLDYPSLLIDMSGSYQIAAMYRWFETWVDDELPDFRIILRNGYDDYFIGKFAPPYILVKEGYGLELPVLCHEMGHAILHYSVYVPYGVMHSYLHETYASYYSGTYRDDLPTACGEPYEYFYHNKLGSYLLNDYYWSALNYCTWAEMVPELGEGCVDSLAWFASYFTESNLASVLQTFLIVDDDDADLSNGTPHFDAIIGAYENHWVGPFLPLIFYRNGSLLDVNDNHDPDEIDVAPGEVSTFAILDTYNWDSVVWNFDDGSAEVNAFEPQHAYQDCGLYEIECRAYHPWGVNIHTLPVNVASANMLALSSDDGSDDYRFQINLSMTNANDVDTLIVPLRFDGDVDMGYDSVYVSGTRLDGWDVAELANEPDSHFVVLQFTGSSALTPGSGLVAKLFFTAYTAPALDDFSPVRIEACAGYDPQDLYPWTDLCLVPGQYTLIYYTGDIDDDGMLTIMDLQRLVEWMFYGGEPLAHPWSADVDCSGQVDALDVEYLRDYFFDMGPPPCGNLYAGQYD